MFGFCWHEVCEQTTSLPLPKLAFVLVESETSAGDSGAVGSCTCVHLRQTQILNSGFKDITKTTQFFPGVNPLDNFEFGQFLTRVKFHWNAVQYIPEVWQTWQKCNLSWIVWKNWQSTSKLWMLYWPTWNAKLFSFHCILETQWGNNKAWYWYWTPGVITFLLGNLVITGLYKVILFVFLTILLRTSKWY